MPFQGNKCFALANIYSGENFFKQGAQAADKLKLALTLSGPVDVVQRFLGA